MLLFETFSDDPSAERAAAVACAGDAETFAREEKRGYLVLCPRAETGALPGARRINLLIAAGLCGPRAGPYLFKVGLWVPTEYRTEFLAWYEVDHLPILLECPTWDGCRLVEEEAEAGCQFHALHQLAEPSALNSREREHSRTTPWFMRLKRNEWFDEPFDRKLYRRSAL